MKRHSSSFVEQTKRMVAGSDLSYREVAKQSGISDSLVSKWCSELKSDSRKIVYKNRIIRNQILDSEKFVIKNEKWEMNRTKLYCALIYGCEGAKYPATSLVSFVNSDPGLVKSFVQLLRRSFVIDERKWRVHLQIHDDQDFAELRKDWSSRLSISENQFYKPTITIKSSKKHNKNYQGTCSVRYSDYKIQLKLIGIFNEFLRKSAVLGGVA